MKLNIPDRRLLPGEFERIDKIVAKAIMRQATGETRATFRGRVDMVAETLERDARADRPGRAIQTVITWTRHSRTALIQVTEYTSHGG